MAVALTVPTVWIVRDVSAGAEKLQGATVAIYAVDVAAAIVIVCALLCARERLMTTVRTAWRRLPGVVVSAGALALYGAVSTVWATDGMLAMQWTVRWVLVLGVIVSLVALRVRLVSMIAVFTLAMAVQSVVGIEQFATQEVVANTYLGTSAHRSVPGYMGVIETPEGRILRAYGFQSHPNIFGGLAAAAILGAVYVASTRRALRWVFLGVALLCTAGVLVSFSRTAVATAVIGGVLLAALLPRVRWAIVPVGGALVVMALVLSPVWSSRVTGDARLERQSVSDRMTQYTQAWTMIASHPYRGVGAGNYVATLYERDATHGAWTYQFVHNVPVLFITEFGVVGGLLCLPALWSVIKRRSLRRRTAALLLAGAALLLLDHYLYTTAVGMYGSAMMVLAAYRVPRTDVRSSANPE